MQAKQIALYSDHMGADKVYNVFLNQKDSGWTVDFTFGGRGKTLKPGTRTTTPVPYDKALKAFDKLVAEKKNGDSHYREEGGSATAYSEMKRTDELFGLIPMQPLPITRAHIEALVKDPAYGFQLKANGENRTIRVKNGEVTAGNKKGKVTAIPESWVTDFTSIGVNFVANGEHVGDVFFAFDLLEYCDVNLMSFSQEERYGRLVQLHARMTELTPAFQLIECHYLTDAKAMLLRHVELNRLEGVVAKLITASYSEGKSKDTFKFKFNETITCIVLAQNAQRSVQLGLLDDDGNMTPVGNVTIPSNKTIPSPGDLVDVQYLYFTGRALEQPVYDPDDTSPRKDIDLDECNLQQIKRHKPASEVEQQQSHCLEFSL